MQAQTRDYEDRIIYRWYLYLPGGKRVIGWATTRDEMRAKCLARRKIAPVRISPAPLNITVLRFGKAQHAD